LTLVLGLDIGGTRSRARLASAAEVLAEGESVSANPAAVGEREAAAVLAELVAEVLAGRVVGAAVAGVAGADSPAALRASAAQLQTLLPEAAVEAVYDTRLVLAAAGLDRGIALVGGTGSAVYARSEAGAEVRAGGWGHLLGDEGSAYWVAREAIRRVLAAADAGREPGPLLAVLGGGDARDLMGAFHASPEPASWAALAPALLAADQSLVEAAADAFCALVETVRQRSGVQGPVVLSGGILLGTAPLEHAVRSRLRGDVRSLDVPPVAGAVRLALGLLPGRPLGGLGAESTL
jgi:N-acetylglucosamine kinase-like BadF-type ATPase